MPERRTGGDDLGTVPEGSRAHPDLPCGSCGASLRRSKSVYLLLLIMSLLLIAGMWGLWLWPAPNWPRATLGVLFLAAWTLLTNHLGWRLVGWVAVEEK